MSSITAHCLVKNEENFIGFAIESVVRYVDSIIVFDTGSEDATVEIIKKLQTKYPGKILFEEKGLCTKEQHTNLRNEMIQKTKTDWFMILDGDEVWTNRGMEEAILCIKSSDEKLRCLMAPFYLCVGDVFHKYYKKYSFTVFNKRGFFTFRFIKKIGVHWQGVYGQDSLYDESNELFFKEQNTLFLKNKFWHLTHLQRSSVDADDFSSGNKRILKRRLTYFVIGRRIKDPIPEVFNKNQELKLGRFKSVGNFFKFCFLKIKNYLMYRFYA